MLLIYGNMQCPDCVDCFRDLDQAGVRYDFVDIFASLPNMKAFLALRDTRTEFLAVKEKGSIGIPCILDGDLISFDWSAYVTQA